MLVTPHLKNGSTLSNFSKLGRRSEWDVRVKLVDVVEGLQKHEDYLSTNFKSRLQQTQGNSSSRKFLNMGWFGKKNSAVAEPVAEDDGHVLALFKKYDKDGNGTIESGELLQALAEMKVRRGGGLVLALLRR